VRTIDAANVDILGSDVRTCLRAGANYVSNERRKHSVSPAADVLEGDVGDIEACLRYVLAMLFGEQPTGGHGFKY
jgi:hypothetical protein